MIEVFRHNGSYGYKAVLDIPPRPITKRGRGYQSADEAYAEGRKDLVNEALLVVSEHWKLARAHLEKASQSDERGKVVSHIANAKQRIEIAVRILQSLSSLQDGGCSENEMTAIYVYPISLREVFSLAHHGNLMRVKRLLAKILEQFPPLLSPNSI